MELQLEEGLIKFIFMNASVCPFEFKMNTNSLYLFRGFFNNLGKVVSIKFSEEQN